MNASTLLLNRSEIAELMTPADYLLAVESAFLAGKQGRAISPPPMQLLVTGGGFHVKGAFLGGERNYAAFKVNGNFPGNPRRAGLPTIQGAIVLCDADNGAVLAILDSIEITLRRTAAASALAARHLAAPDASTVAICGCGDQARAQAEALFQVARFERCFAWDIDPAKAERFCTEMSEALGCRFEAARNLRDATLPADVIVTCTTAHTPFLTEADVSPGAFVAAVGADNPEKSEIAPALMAKAAVVVDVLDQCLRIGDLHHAVDAGVMSAADVRADLGDVVARARPGRLEAKEIVIFDSTGTAIQDVVSAALACERARERGRGLAFPLA
jgi:ornithine cyclodeaminase/alanine dehydrogenase-like protein (mu-crystallin family)